MRRNGRLALLAILAIAGWPAAAAAQTAAPVAIEPGAPSAAASEFRMAPPRDRAAPGPIRNGLIGAIPLGDNLLLGVGRFTVAEPARLRTHTESDRRAADVRPRDRGIAAVGLSLRF